MKGPPAPTTGIDPRDGGPPVSLEDDHLTYRCGSPAAILLLCASIQGAAQSSASSSQDPPTSPEASSSAFPGVGSPSISAATIPKDYEPMTWSHMGWNVLRDQKSIWLSPVQVVRGKHWKPALGVGLATASLIALDPHTTPYFRRTATFGDFNKVASGGNTSLCTILFPLGFYAAGLVRRDAYAQSTALLTAEAVADAQILTAVMKSIDRRYRPADIPPNGSLADTWFKPRANSWLLSGDGSFPSGHTIAAFSVATVFAERYRHHRWVPWVAYGTAALIGFSRVSLLSHFPSDVFAGAALGYAIGHYAVLPRTVH